MNSNPQHLHRFRTAQGENAHGAYSQALSELRAGRKCSHWIWFVLPQLAGPAKARVYLADPLLRQWLEAVISVIEEQLCRLTSTQLVGAEVRLSPPDGARDPWNGALH